MKENGHFNDVEESRKKWIKAFLPDPFRELTLDEYADRHPDYTDQVEAVRDYIEDIRYGGRRTLVAYGPAGSGKTELASAVWNAVAPAVPDRNHYQDTRKAQTADNVLFVVGQDLPDYWKNDGTAEYLVNSTHLNSAWFCVLDDVDKAPAGAWSTELLRLINARVWVRRIPTVITMNLTPAQLARKYGDSGEPILSRLERSGALFLRIGSKP